MTGSDECYFDPVIQPTVTGGAGCAHCIVESRTCIIKHVACKTADITCMEWRQSHHQVSWVNNKDIASPQYTHAIDKCDQRRILESRRAQLMARVEEKKLMTENSSVMMTALRAALGRKA